MSNFDELVIAVLAMVKVDEVTEGVREHLDPPGTTLNRFFFE